MTSNDLDQAREVADTIARYPKAYDSGMQAVARVIASLPDEWIDADKLREVIEEARFLIRVGEPEIILNDLIALLAAANHAEGVGTNE